MISKRKIDKEEVLEKVNSKSEPKEFKNYNKAVLNHSVFEKSSGLKSVCSFVSHSIQ